MPSSPFEGVGLNASVGVAPALFPPEVVSVFTRSGTSVADAGFGKSVRGGAGGSIATEFGAVVSVGVSWGVVGVS